MFNIEKVPFGNTLAYRLSDADKTIYADVVPSLGGILNAFGVVAANESIDIIDGYGNDTAFFEGNTQAFKSNVLFPFPNRIKGGTYSYAGKKYDLKINFEHENNSIHGLVYDKPFKLVATTVHKNYCSLILQLQSFGEQGYPFPFLLQLEYRLMYHSLTCFAMIKNTGVHKMLYGLGWHHYFKMATAVGTLNFQLPTNTNLQVGQYLIPTGAKEKTVDFSAIKPIGDTKLDTCFVIKSGGDVKIVLENTQKTLKLELEFQSADFPYLQVYTPAHRSSIAIEPMTCAPDAFNNQMGLRFLQVGESKRFSFSMRVSV